MAEGAAGQSWIVRVDVEGWEDRKCTDTFEALDIKVAAKGLTHVERDRASVPRSGWVELELDARDEDHARKRVMGVLEQCGATGTAISASLAPG